jgi:hypothetical protein
MAGNGAALRRCKLALLQLASRNAAALLQHASQKSYDTVSAALVAVALRRCCCSTSRESAATRL